MFTSGITCLPMTPIRRPKDGLIQMEPSGFAERASKTFERGSTFGWIRLRPELCADPVFGDRGQSEPPWAAAVHLGHRRPVGTSPNVTAPGMQPVPPTGSRREHSGARVVGGGKSPWVDQTYPSRSASFAQYPCVPASQTHRQGYRVARLSPSGPSLSLPRRQSTRSRRSGAVRIGRS
jgi:hypothetical protein